MAQKCLNCGAPLNTGGGCDYCGVGFNKHRLILTETGNHPRLIISLLEEMAEYFFSPAKTEITRHLAGAVIDLKTAENGKLIKPILILESDDPRELNRYLKKIMENGGKAEIS